MDTPLYTTRIITSFFEIDARAWNLLTGTNNPFLCYEFFISLEENKHLNHDSGWDCRIVCVFDQNHTLCAAMPMFLKSHSWAEFVFDWQWANAYAQHGLKYYPKLVITTPYTPASCNKLLTHPRHDKHNLAQRLITDALAYANETNDITSLHALFLSDAEKQLWKNAHCLERQDIQFHWNNNWLDTENASFDDFLQRMKTKKRKNTRQERRYLHAENIQIKQTYASDIPIDQWNDLYLCYANTFLERGQPPYFSQELFHSLAHNMGKKIPIFIAEKDGNLLACSICFESEDTLYGRYWGAKEHIKNLHFELCYYQTIEYALKTGKRVIEPGTGGGHKLRRGFEPTITTSMHWLKHAGFHSAVSKFLEEESIAILEYKESIKEHLPFKA